MDVTAAASGLVAYAQAHDLIGPEDATWAYNRILEDVGAWGPGRVVPAGRGDYPDLDGLLSSLSRAAIERGVIADDATSEDELHMRVMGELTPRPSEVARRFDDLLAERGPQAATDYFYRLSCDVDYVRRSAIARNVRWVTPTSWGDLEVTINRSKPEKDPRAIARVLTTPAGEAYPACQLCMENEGYSGHPAASGAKEHPARQNLRIVPIILGGERWGLQYSPYAYYSEHCIAMSSEHRPMHVDGPALERLLDFVDLLPHYFVGSNADLPIVGGSILTHDHFQGGRHTFPMERAQVDETIQLGAFPGVEAGILRWPLTVIRLSSTDRGLLARAATRVLEGWRGYSDPDVGILARTDGVPHNTVTPICRKQAGTYTFDLALRCNVTTKQHPLGLFHPHEELHHIKKENIGLIEAMGLAILPPRLEPELACVSEHLVSGDLEGLSSDPLSASHATWACQVASRHPEMDKGNVDAILRDEVGAVFGRVLEDAGVFKWDEDGRAALARFVSTL